MFEDLPPWLIKLVPGGVGALASVRWLSGQWLQRLHMGLVGWALAYYVAPDVAAFARAKPEAVGFLIGLFGVAVIQQIFQNLAKADISAWLGRTLDQLVRKVLGLPAQQEK
jgi:hypothetical protein